MPLPETELTVITVRGMIPEDISFLRKVYFRTKYLLGMNVNSIFYDFRNQYVLMIENSLC